MKKLHRYGPIIWIMIVALWSCSGQENVQKEKSVQEIMTEGPISNSSIIRNPVSAEKPRDTTNIAKIEFTKTSHDFGRVEEGALVRRQFHFTNTGKAPLIISNARSTCGCTVPNWPKDPIPPGGKGMIKVQFNTRNKTKRQSKPIRITANTYPATTEVYLTGYVIPQKPSKEQ